MAVEKKQTETASVPAPTAVPDDLKAQATNLGLSPEVFLVLGQLIAQGIRDAMAPMMPRKSMSIGEYLRKHAKKNRLNREYWDNGFRIYDSVLSEAEVAKLNLVHRPGRYINRRVEVVIANEGRDGEIVYFRYSNATVDQRMENARLWRTWEELLDKVLIEQTAKDVEEDEIAQDVAERRAARQQAKELVKS